MTLEEAKKKFRSSGIPINAWARAQGFSPALVYSVLSGRARGDRGESHKILVALGIKAQPTQESLGLRFENEVDR